MPFSCWRAPVRFNFGCTCTPYLLSTRENRPSVLLWRRVLIYFPVGTRIEHRSLRDDARVVFASSDLIPSPSSGCTDPPPRAQVLPNLLGIETQQPPDIHVRQSRAAEVVHVPHRAPQKRRDIVNCPEVLGRVGSFNVGVHAHGGASTLVEPTGTLLNVGSTRHFNMHRALTSALFSFGKQASFLA